MLLHVDSRKRITIPNAANLRPGSTVELEILPDGRLVLVPVATVPKHELRAWTPEKLKAVSDPMKGSRPSIVPESPEPMKKSLYPAGVTLRQAEAAKQAIQSSAPARPRNEEGSPGAPTAMGNEVLPIYPLTAHPRGEGGRKMLLHVDSRKRITIPNDANLRPRDTVELEIDPDGCLVLVPVAILPKHQLGKRRDGEG